jgi:hypothetical protein
MTGRRGRVDDAAVEPIRDTATTAHRAFAVLLGALILLCLAASFAYAATAGA